METSGRGRIRAKQINNFKHRKYQHKTQNKLQKCVKHTQTHLIETNDKNQLFLMFYNE